MGLLSNHDSDIIKPIKKYCNTWLNIDTHLPPNTDASIVICDPAIPQKTLFVSHVFLKHYLMARFYYGFELRPIWKHIKYFMLLDDPQ